MPASRLRLRIALGFAVVFAAALAIFAAASVTYLRRESERRLDGRLGAVARDVVAGVQRELEESPDSTIGFASHEVVYEWPANGDAFVVLDATGRAVAALDRDSTASAVVAAYPPAGDTARFDVRSGVARYRVVVRPVTFPGTLRRPPRQFTVLAFGSTRGIEDDVRVLGSALAVAAPLILFLALGAGYLLSGRALAPVADLGQAIAGVAPTDLSRRLVVAGSGDEVDRIAVEFNSLMARLDDAQRRNRGFVREAAHQIRTPLTLVLGESAHVLADARADAAALRAALQRVGGAAEQMRRRVDELFLLAEAQSGEPVRLEDAVELDGLLLDTTDLMRGRAASLGRQLAIGEADHVVVRGNAALLREALLELIENGCRHGFAGGTVTVSARALDAEERLAGRFAARIAVRNTGAPFILESRAGDGPRSRGLGLPIVRWIAESHEGTLTLERDGTDNVVVITLPRVSTATAHTARDPGGARAACD